MAHNVEFPEQGPFSLQVAQSASARALSDVVEMILKVIVRGVPEPVYVQMTHGVANSLGHALVNAALEVEARKS